VENSRQRILDGALDSFSRYGYKKVEMSDLAEQVGLSRQGLYRHFSSKEALFQAVVEHIHATTLSLAATAAAQADAAGPVAVLTALLGQRFAWFLERVYGTPHGAELLSESGRQCSAINAAASQKFAQMLRAAIDAEVSRGRLALGPAGLDPARLTELLLRAAYGLKSPDPVPLSAAEFQSRLGQLVQLLCASLIPPQLPKPRARSSR
jgi:AcrR family transcriptional regulator